MFLDPNSSFGNVSFGTAIGGLVLCQLGLPLPETLFLVSAGVAAEQAELAVWIPVLASIVGVLAGDLLLFAVSRALGPLALRRLPPRWLLPPHALPRVDALLRHHGAVAVFVARFISGVRGAFFVIAATRGMPLHQFLIGDGLAILVSVPLFAALGFWGSRNLATLRVRVDQANLGLIICVLVASLLYVAWTAFQRRSAKKV